MGGDHRYAGDDGSASPAVAAALADYAAGRGSEHAALTVLAGSRLLVPVVAMPAEPEGEPALGAGPAPGGGLPAPRRSAAGGGAGNAGGTRPAGAVSSDAPGRHHGARRSRATDVAMPTLVGKDGRRAVLAFTCLDSLARWRPDARPVPVPAAGVWQAGAQDADAVVVDVAGPVPLAVDGARLAALAQGRPAPQAHEDPDMLAAVRSAVGADPAIAGIGLLPGAGDSDLTLHLAVAPGTGTGTGPGQVAVQAAVERAAGALMAAAAGRLRRGIEVAVTEAGVTEVGTPGPGTHPGHPGRVATGTQGPGGTDTGGAGPAGDGPPASRP